MKKAFRYACTLTAIAFLPGISIAGNLDFPEGYTGWHHAKTLILKANHPLADPFAGLHHIYVNDKGWKAYLSGGPYPKGSILVFDLYEVNDMDNAIAEGKRKFIGVMKKTGEKHLNGWRYEVFAGPGLKAQKANEQSCHACHAQQKTRDFVFSAFTHGR